MTPQQALTNILNRLQALIPQNQIGQDIVAAVNVENEIIIKALQDGEENAAALEAIKAEQKLKGEKNDVG